MFQTITKQYLGFLVVLLLGLFLGMGAMACVHEDKVVKQKENQKMLDYDPYNEALSSAVLDGGARK